MLKMSLAEIAQFCNGTVDPRHAQKQVVGVSTDTRTLSAGNLFVAIKGERFDGNDHIGTAFKNSAAACIGSRAASNDPSQPVVYVDDPLASLQILAQSWKKRFALPTVAITGSNGKSTVKEMVAAILTEACVPNQNAVLATRGNLNNHIGVPLMLCKLESAHQYAVLEAGMNHFGEIALLTRLIAPTVALITNAGPAHLEGVGSIAGVAQAKAEIFEGLDHQGVAIINGDDAFCTYWMEKSQGRKVLRFGRGPECEVRGEWSDAHAGAILKIYANAQTIDAEITVAGSHNRMNALAACAIGLSFGIPMYVIAQGLRRYKPMSGRQTLRRGRNGATIIDDSYNANAASIRAGMETLAMRGGTRIVALGQMAELGEHSEQLHQSVGRLFTENKLDVFFATGERLKVAVAAAGPNARWFESKEQLAAALLPLLNPTVSVLVKGSRSSAMEKVVSALMDPESELEMD